MSSISRSYSAFEPSHQTTRLGAVRPAASSTHFSTKCVVVIAQSSQRSRVKAFGFALLKRACRPAAIRPDAAYGLSLYLARPGRFNRAFAQPGLVGDCLREQAREDGLQLTSTPAIRRDARRPRPEEASVVGV